MRFILASADIARLDRLTEPFTADYDLDDPSTLRELGLRAQDLPKRLRAFLADFRHEQAGAVCMVSALPVDDKTLGPTPLHWGRRRLASPSARQEAVMLMCASLLGDVFGWATQQDGAIVNDILPVPGHEHEQLGSGSTAALMWHTEEAFHPLRCDYLGLLCLRNDGIGTVLADIADVALDEHDRAALAQPRFTICPDGSHLMKQEGPRTATDKERRLLADARERMRQMNESPGAFCVLSGDPDSPYLCVDPAYMRALPDDIAAEAALGRLERAIDEATKQVALAAGEICFIDNFRAVHGREPFQPRYDGTDRWLKRVNVTRDLRRSRAYRVSSDSRVIF